MDDDVEQEIILNNTSDINNVVNDNGENSQLPEEEEIPFISIFDTLDAPRILPNPKEITYDLIKQVQNELGLISLCWPIVKHPEFEGRLEFPESYTRNSEKEKVLLFTAENFRKQFVYRFPNRKQLFLACDNECNIQKMVCTSICPTVLPFIELEEWKSVAEFFGDHMEYETLDEPTLFPTRLCSPYTTISRQSGNCFELSTALCSLLLGLGYDAYVVSGYAIYDVTYNIMCRVDSPYPVEKEIAEEKKEDNVVQKYNLKPARDLRSKFLMMLEQRVIDQKIAEEKKKKDEELEKMKLEEAYPEDCLNGFRIHSWVLMLTDGRKIDEPFFIEPTTGLSYPLDTFNYNGIESVWNHVNYWINMQECGQDLSTLDYDLRKLDKWEHLLIGEPFHWREYKPDMEAEEDEIERIRIYQEKHLDMPMSWSLPIEIPHSVIATRYPGGKKIVHYKRTFVEKYAPYHLQDGLITRVTRYKDFDCTIPVTIEDTYQHRKDKMYKSIFDVITYKREEFFKTGREDCVLKHSYYIEDTGEIDMDRLIEFDSKARYDSLSSLLLKTNEMIETYVDKESRLYYRYVKYSAKGYPPPGMVESHKRIITHILEKFHRNEDVPASKDIAERSFAVYDREIYLRFHYDTGKVTASTRTFIKPPLAEMGERMKFNPELTFGYHADLKVDPPTSLELFLLFKKQLEDETKTIQNIRELEDQVGDFLHLREVENGFVELVVDLFNREHNEQYRLGMLDREQQERQQREKETEPDVDYLEPYLEKLGFKDDMSVEKAIQLKEMCLNDLKNTLVKRANTIQKNLERAKENLARKNEWYHMMRDKLKPEEEIQYFEELHQMNFVLQAFVERLERHRELSFYRYAAMVRYLNNHHRLNLIRRDEDVSAILR